MKRRLLTRHSRRVYVCPFIHNSENKVELAQGYVVITGLDLVTRNNTTPHCFNLKPKRYSEFSLFRVWAIPSEIRGHCWWHRRRWSLRGRGAEGESGAAPAMPLLAARSTKPITVVGEKEIGCFCRALFK